MSETKISFEQSEIRNNRQSEAAENTIDEKESPQKAENDDNPEGVAKKIKKVHFFVGPFGLYLQNSYFLVSTLLFRAFLWE